MRKRLLLTLIGAVALPAYALQPISVGQLEQTLPTLQGKPDAEVAQQLSSLELTERISAGKREHWGTIAAGPKTRQALLALADQSAFLDLPPAEVPANPAPDFASQRRIIARTIGYATKTMHQLPNLSATRVTTSFQDEPWKYDKTQMQHRRDQPLQLVGVQSATVLYRKGDEVVQSGASEPLKTFEGLTTSGEFGPILLTMLLDAAHSKLAWSHWETGLAGPLAVFSSVVPEARSHYQVAYCCIQNANGDRMNFQQFSGYRGEIAVDPQNGTILRVSLRADLRPSDPIVRADVLVEYGPVEIGGKTYMCPLRSVALSLQSELAPVSGVGKRPLQTSLNDTVFERYHLFRADAHIVDGTPTETATEPVPH